MRVYLVVFLHIENLSSNGTTSQSADYFWPEKQMYLTADLAITGGPAQVCHVLPHVLDLHSMLPGGC